MSDDPVADLIAKCAARDRAAFRALYRASSAKLMGVLLRLLKDRPEAEAALQEVYIRLWARAGSHDRAQVRGMCWLIAMARHLAIDRLRARPQALGSGGPDRVADTPLRAQTRLTVTGEARRMADCLAALAPARAAALRSAYLDGASHLRLAQDHAVPPNTMRTWLRLSLLKLKECLER